MEAQSSSSSSYKICAWRIEDAQPERSKVGFSFLPEIPCFQKEKDVKMTLVFIRLLLTSIWRVDSREIPWWEIRPFGFARDNGLWSGEESVRRCTYRNLNGYWKMEKRRKLIHLGWPLRSCIHCLQS